MIKIPPNNFGMIEKSIYRCKIPDKKNYDFLKPLNIKTIIHLSLETITNSFSNFITQNKINIITKGKLILTHRIREKLL
jgi:hypothetical protein